MPSKQACREVPFGHLLHSVVPAKKVGTGQLFCGSYPVRLKYVLIFHCMCKWSVLYLILATTASSCLGFGNLLLICEFRSQRSELNCAPVVYVLRRKTPTFMSAHKIPHTSICGIICDRGSVLCRFYITLEMLSSSASGQCTGPRLSSSSARTWKIHFILW